MIFTGTCSSSPRVRARISRARQDGVAGLHDRLFRLGNLGLGPHVIQVGDFPGLKKGLGQLAEFLPLAERLLGHPEIFLGLHQAVEGLGHRIGQFIGSPLDFLFLGLRAGLGGLGIVIGL